MASSDNEGLFEALPEQVAPERAGGGLPRLRIAERNQMAWRPVSLDGPLADDHRARLVWRFVEGLDLTALDAISQPSAAFLVIRSSIQQDRKIRFGAQISAAKELRSLKTLTRTGGLI